MTVNPNTNNKTNLDHQQTLLVLAIPTLLAGVALGFTCGILPFTVTRSTDSFNLLSKAIIAWKSGSWRGYWSAPVARGLSK